MDLLPIDEFLTDLCPFEKKLDLGDYEGEAPRWCQGCGDLGIRVAQEGDDNANVAVGDRHVRQPAAS